MINGNENIFSEVKDFFKEANLNYKDLSVTYSDNINFENYFDLTPDDYLKFSKIDLKQRDERGLINALSNAKRAIDCLIENVLRNFNINIKKLPKEALNFCDEVLSNDDKQISPASLRLFCALGLSPSILVSEVRHLRNQVEHEFSSPKKEDVLRAYEVAELLINNLKAKELYSCAIDISSIEISTNTVNSIGFDFKSSYSKEHNRFYINAYDGKGGVSYYYFKQEDKVYYYFLKAMFIAEFDLEELASCIKLIIKEISPNLSLDEINVKFGN